MTTPLDAILVGEALGLIATYGTYMEFTVPAPTYDRTTGSVSGSGASVVRKASPPLAYSLRYADSDVVRRGDARIYVAASGLTFTPDLNTKVVHDSVTWRVVDVNRLYSGDDLAAYELQVRR